MLKATMVAIATGWYRVGPREEGPDPVVCAVRAWCHPTQRVQLHWVRWCDLAEKCGRQAVVLQAVAVSKTRGVAGAVGYGEVVQFGKGIRVHRPARRRRRRVRTSQCHSDERVPDPRRRPSGRVRGQGGPEGVAGGERPPCLSRGGRPSRPGRGGLPDQVARRRCRAARHFARALLRAQPVAAPRRRAAPGRGLAPNDPL